MLAASKIARLAAASQTRSSNEQSKQDGQRLRVSAHDNLIASMPRLLRSTVSTLVFDVLCTYTEFKDAKGRCPDSLTPKAEIRSAVRQTLGC